MFMHMNDDLITTLISSLFIKWRLCWMMLNDKKFVRCPQTGQPFSRQKRYQNRFNPFCLHGLCEYCVHLSPSSFSVAFIVTSTFLFFFLPSQYLNSKPWPWRTRRQMRALRARWFKYQILFDCFTDMFFFSICNVWFYWLFLYLQIFIRDFKQK